MNGPHLHGGSGTKTLAENQVSVVLAQSKCSRVCGIEKAWHMTWICDLYCSVYACDGPSARLGDKWLCLQGNV